MPRDLDQDLFYRPPGTLHFNIQLKGGFLHSRVTARGFEGLRPEQIDRVWIIEEQRRATSDEIWKLCKPGPKR